MSKEIFDEFSDKYSAEVEESIKFVGVGHDFFIKGKADILNNFLTSGKVLDIGCGTGEIHPYLNQNVIELQGIDISDKSIVQAKKLNPKIQYSTYDGMVLPFSDNTFDSIFTICVMHHVPPAQWAEFVKEAHRVLKPDGRFIVIEHNPYNPLTRLAVNRCPFDKDAVLLSRSKTESLCSTHFDSINTDYIFFFPFKANIFKHIEKYLKWLPLGAQYITNGVKSKVSAI